jgi:subtilisin family serine protease
VPSRPAHTISIERPPFAGRTGLGDRIAIIDSGIAPGHPHDGASQPGVHVLEGGDDPDVMDRIGHGTAVAAAIREKAPAAQLVPIRVFERHLSTTAEILARAIRHAAGLECRLINLSLGTTNPARRSLLQGAVAEACDAGCILVSPGAQDGVDWLPGCLEGVIRTHLDWTCPRDALRIDLSDPERATLNASGYPRPIPGVSPDRNLHGISFATANTTGMLARWLEREPDVRRAEDVLRSLRDEAD